MGVRLTAPPAGSMPQGIWANSVRLKDFTGVGGAARDPLAGCTDPPFITDARAGLRMGLSVAKEFTDAAPWANASCSALACLSAGRPWLSLRRRFLNAHKASARQQHRARPATAAKLATRARFPVSAEDDEDDVEEDEVAPQPEENIVDVGGRSDHGHVWGAVALAGRGACSAHPASAWKQPSAVDDTMLLLSEQLCSDNWQAAYEELTVVRDVTVDAARSETAENPRCKTP